MPTPRLYGRAAVQARARYLAEHPLCKHCQDKGRISAAIEVDHIIPLHKDGSDEDSNKQGLCLPCHKAKTAQDMGYLERGADVTGQPLSPRHHWNQA